MTTPDPQRLETFLRVDREMTAVLTTLAPIVDPDEMAPAIRPSFHFCNFDAFRNQRGWSSGEQAVIDWAEALWVGQPLVLDLARIAGLEDEYVKACLDGLEVYRGKPLPATLRQLALSAATAP